MSYATQSIMSKDVDLWDRMAACAATQRLPDSFHWVNVNQWALCASPGWDDSYSYAMNTDVERPGWQDTVITDGQILSAVQARLAEEAPAAPAPE